MRFSYATKRKLLGFTFLIPFLLGFFMFFAKPLVETFKYSFNKITITKPGSAQPYEELPEESPVNLSVNIQEWQTGFSGDYTVQ